MPDRFPGYLFKAVEEGPMPIPEAPSLSRFFRQLFLVGWDKPFAVGVMLGCYYISQDKMQIYYMFGTRFAHCLRDSQSLWGAGAFYALRGEYERHYHDLDDPYKHYIFPFICGLLFSQQMLSIVYGFGFLPWEDCDQHAWKIAIPYAAPRITAAVCGSISPLTQHFALNDPVEQAGILSAVVLAYHGYAWAHKDLSSMLLSWFIGISAFLFPEDKPLTGWAPIFFTFTFIIALVHAHPFRDVITTENIASLLEHYFPPDVETDYMAPSPMG